MRIVTSEVRGQKTRDARHKKIFFLSVAFCLLSAVCGLWPSVSFAAQERFFEVSARKFSYTPNILRVNQGDHVRVRLISEDVHHGFFLDGYGIKTSAHPGQDGALDFTADKPGRFSFRCSVTCGEFHPYMVGYLTVAPNARFYLTALIVLACGIGNAVLLFSRRRQND